MKDTKKGDVKVHSEIPEKVILVKDNNKKKTRKLKYAMLPIILAATVATSILTSNITEEVIYLKKAGVDTKNAFYASISPNYSQKEIKEQIEEFDNILENEFPNVKFHDSGSSVLSNDNWYEEGQIDQLAGFYNNVYDVAVYNSNYPERYAHENFHRRTRHSVITSDNKKVEYSGLKRLTDGKGRKLDEALAGYIERNVYNEKSCYFETRYLDLIFQFISVDEVVKISAEGGMEDLERLFSPYFDCDIVDLIDNTPGVDEVLNYGAKYVTKELTYRADVITDAFYKYIEMSNLDNNVKIDKINSFREILSKNFVKSVSHFDSLFENYLGGKQLK